MENELIYVYCISDTPPGDALDAQSNAWKSLKFDDFHVIVKYVPESSFSEENFKKNLNDLPWVETNARDHIRIIGTIMEYNTVIPFKFGTIYTSKAGLRDFIREYSTSLIDNFNHLRGKEEWSVKVYCNRKALCEQIDQFSEKAADLEKQIMASSPGKAFLLGRKKIDLIDAEMDRLCKDFGQKYFDIFHALSESSSLSNLLPKEYTGREDAMILNATFLIEKQKVSEFIQTYETLQRADENSGFIIETTGPWPPFSFVSIKEKQ